MTLQFQRQPEIIPHWIIVPGHVALVKGFLLERLIKSRPLVSHYRLRNRGKWKRFLLSWKYFFCCCSTQRGRTTTPFAVLWQRETSISGSLGQVVGKKKKTHNNMKTGLAARQTHSMTSGISSCQKSKRHVHHSLWGHTSILALSPWQVLCFPWRHGSLHALILRNTSIAHCDVKCIPY